MAESGFLASFAYRNFLIVSWPPLLRYAEARTSVPLCALVLRYGTLVLALRDAVDSERMENLVGPFVQFLELLLRNQDLVWGPGGFLAKTTRVDPLSSVFCLTAGLLFQIRRARGSKETLLPIFSSYGLWSSRTPALTKSDAVSVSSETHLQKFAVAAVRRLIEIQPENPLFRVQHGDLLFAEGEYVAALKEFLLFGALTHNHFCSVSMVAQLDPVFVEVLPKMVQALTEINARLQALILLQFLSPIPHATAYSLIKEQGSLDATLFQYLW